MPLDVAKNTFVGCIPVTVLPLKYPLAVRAYERDLVKRAIAFQNGTRDIIGRSPDPARSYRMSPFMLIGMFETRLFRKRHGTGGHDCFE